MATKWAICGAGKISSDFCHALKLLPESDHQIVAVAASDKGRAAEFAAKFEIPESYGSYEELAKLENVDVVYIGTIHIFHVEQSLMFINAGKNVLCEKPMALTLDGCRRVLSAAKEKGVLFSEGFWSRFFPVYEEIRNCLSSGALGDVRMVQANFSTPMVTPQFTKLELGGGALMTFGLYTIQATNLVFKGKPEEVVIRAKKTSDSGLDLAGAMILSYGEGRLASLSYSAEMTLEKNYFTIRGTKGILQVPDFFWCPTEVILPDGQVKKFALPDGKDNYTYANSQGLMYEAQAMRESLKKGLKECPKLPHTDSETISTILQDCLDQMGIKYQHP